MLSWHLEPLTCGVAKFNVQLARKLGVPCLPVYGHESRCPLLSIKFSELGKSRLFMGAAPYSLFLHDAPTDPLLVRKATRVYAANRAIADAVRPDRPDVIELWCPSTVDGAADRAGLNILTFGMAHKFQGCLFTQLKALLERYGKPYTISLSTGIHEGTPWQAGFRENVALMRGIFGDRLRVLGFLGDDALAKELHDCTAVALFYDPALRANNTTAWAALEAGAPLITNLDADSPAELEHGVHCFNLSQMPDWPTGEALDRFSRAAARRVAATYAWDRLIERLTA